MTPFLPNSIADALPYQPYSEASPFVTGPVSLFPPPKMTTQIPFPSPGAAMFPPSYGAQFPNPVIPPQPKPSEDPVHFTPSSCTAAFTSSLHNMAITAAMVSVPSQITEKTDTIEDINPSFTQTEEIPNVPVPNIVNNTNPVEESAKSASSTPAGKKSPSKPTRTSARFISQQSKSPSKSPGKSPRQLEHKTAKTKETSKRGGKVINRGSYSQNRGRGRGRGRTRNVPHQDIDTYITSNTIHNKLVGTVYDLDFDDDIANDNMADLRAMRERRRSTDLHKSDISLETSESPKFTSPSHKFNRNYTSDLKELRPPTPITDIKIPSPNTIPEQTFADIGQPVLPGPVDMRTYNSSFETQNTDAVTYSNQILKEFATVGPQLCEIDDEYEKNLELSLRSEKRTEVIETQVTETNLKVSLSDSRNQLKVKIKGPFLDSNYTSTVTQIQTQTNVSLDTDTSSFSAVTSSNNSISNTTVTTGTSNLRRMRKKELLRQYWTQDMNMDEPASAQNIVPTTIPVSRTIITIPKAVASMTSIPTREDYKAVVDANMEKKRRKEKQGATGYMRELRNLDMEDDNVPERRRSVGSTGSNASTGNYEGNYKRKGRPPRQTTQPITPKLKIKIGGNFIGDTTYSTIDDKKYKGRPPKKRIQTVEPVKPNVVDYKRESMKYRRQVMADFGEKKKRSKGDKGKRKKRKNKHEVQIISNDTSVNKLIIRIGKKKDESVIDSEKTDLEHKPITNQLDNRTLVDTAQPTIPQIPINSTSDLRKVRPIKLKLARCLEGYVMKSDTGQSSGEPPPGKSIEPPKTVEPPVLVQSPSESVTQVETTESVLPQVIALPEPPSTRSPPREAPCNPLPLNKDCEVR